MTAPHRQLPEKIRDHAPVAVLGLGNRLLTDEGVGIAAAEEIAQLGLGGADVLDGGTLGLALLPAIEGRESLLILDAVTAHGRQPGDVLVLTGDTLRRGWRRCLSAHQLGITDVLALAALSGCAPARVTAVAMIPASLDTGWGLSGPAQRALPAMVAAARTVLRSWGVAGA
jgi:hydrogenase maturation protease